MARDYSRRWLLLSGTLALAGCTGNDGTAATEATGTATAAPDPATDATTAGESAETAATPTDRGPATLASFEATPLETAGQVEFDLVVEATGLSSLRIETPVDSATPTVDGDRAEVTTTLEAEPMTVNDVTIAVESAEGESRFTRQSYARKYDVQTETPFHVGATYQQFTGSWGANSDKIGAFRRCGVEAVAEPTLGYWDVNDSRAMNGHVDQMEGHGITSVQINFNGKPGRADMYEAFADNQLPQQVDVEANVDMGKLWKWMETDDWHDYLDTVAERFQTYLAHPNYRSVEDGRPLVTFWGAGNVAWREESNEYILEEWGDYAAFADYLKEAFGDEQPAYIVGDTPSGPEGVGGEKYEDFYRNWDGVTTWGQNAHKIQDWGEVLAKTERDFEMTRAYAEENDLGFVPMTFPGFDDRHNTCWGKDRHMERSVDGFRETIDLAIEYKTEVPNKISIMTWCDWAEGTQVEPGTFRGEDYGTDYVEQIAEAQRGQTQ